MKASLSFILLLLLTTGQIEGRDPVPPTPEEVVTVQPVLPTQEPPSDECLSSLEDNDFQLFPGCSMQQTVDNAMNVVRGYLNRFPFEDKETCFKKTRSVVTDVVDAMIPCVKGDCKDNLFEEILKAVSEEVYDAFQNITEDTIKEGFTVMYKNITDEQMDQALALVCPEAGQNPPFLVLLPDISGNDFSTGLLKQIEDVLGMLFNSPSTDQARSAPDGGCSYFKDSLNAIVGQFDLSETISTMVPTTTETAPVKLVLTSAKGQIKSGQDMILESLESLVCENGNSGASDMKSLISFVCVATFISILL